MPRRDKSHLPGPQNSSPPPQIDTFDCTGPPEWGVPEKLKDRVRFHRKCVANREGQFNITDTDTREFVTYGTALVRARRRARCPVSSPLCVTLLDNQTPFPFRKTPHRR